MSISSPFSVRMSNLGNPDQRNEQDIKRPRNEERGVCNFTAMRHNTGATEVALASSSRSSISHRHFRVSSWEEISGNEKHIPYFSDRYIAQIGAGPLNLNGKVLKSDSCEKIVCSHLAMQFLLSGRENPGKILPHELFGSQEAIKKNVHPDIEIICRAELAAACGKYIFSNDRFGHYLSRWAASLEQGQQKHFFLQSKNHAFAIRIHRKSNITGPDDLYIVHFYEPNLTNIKVRCAVDNPQRFDSPEFALRNFMSSEAYNVYFNSSE